MYKHLLRLLLPSLFIIGCQEETTTTGTGDQNPPPTFSTLSGKLENWTFGTGKTIKFVRFRGPNYQEFASSAIASDGSFTLTFSTPSADQLDSLGSTGEGCTGVITANVLGVKVVGDANFYIFEGTNMVGYVALMSRNMMADTVQTPQLNDIFFSPTYFTASATVNGSMTCFEDWDDDGTRETYVTQVVENKKIAAGWNEIFTKVTARSGNSITFTFISGPQSGLKWYYRY